MTNLLDDINHDKMVVLEAKIRVTEGVQLYDLVQVMKMCLASNIVVPKTF